MGKDKTETEETTREPSIRVFATDGDWQWAHEDENGGNIASSETTFDTMRAAHENAVAMAPQGVGVWVDYS